MKLVVGLGNPGSRYEGTRHNVGFDVVTELARQHSAGKPKVKHEGLVSEVTVAENRVLLLAPQTYMNASGRSVKQAVTFYQLSPEDVFIVCDDIHLPLGRIRLRSSGSAGGQKGLQNIIQQLGGEDFSRLRIGVGEPPGGRDATDYVLRRFPRKEREIIDHAVVRAADAVDCWVREGIERAMNGYNAAPADE